MHFEANSCQRGEETMERSQLVSEPETRNNNVTIHNFTSSSNNGNSASIEGEQRRNQPSALPYRSQHFTQVKNQLH